MAIEITMPRLSDTMETGTIISWNVKEGDAVSSGDVVADVETDKATMEMQVYDDGTIAKILIGEGQTVDVGTMIAVVAEDDESVEDAMSSVGGGSTAPAAGDAPASSKPEPKPEPKSASASASASAPAAPASAHVDSNGNGRVRVSPVARQLAEDHGIDLKSIQGSGPSGRIIKRDVLQAVDAGAETAASIPPSASGSGTAPIAQPLARIAPQPSMGFGLQDQIIPLSNMRQVIARRLVESKTTIPHYQVTVTFDMDPLMELRKSLNEQLFEQGVKLSVNDFLVKGCALAMYKHPEFNASWTDAGIHIHGQINVGVAVSLPEERGGGLVVASIPAADQKSLRVISAETRTLAEKARTRGLAPEEMSGATFTLSNLGMYGVDNFTAIINPPNSAILAVGAALQKPVVRDGQLVVGREMSGTLSLDHRVIDGAMAARYLQTLKQMIEHPATLLVERNDGDRAKERPMSQPQTDYAPRLYEDEGDLLLRADQSADRVMLLPSGDPRKATGDRDRIRIQWGQHLLADLTAGRYRTVVCAVNQVDNSHGILGELLELVPTCQWSMKSATSYARVFQESVALHAGDDREPYILKYDLDRLLILGILRPHGRDHLTLKDLSRGFNTIAKMLAGRRERWPVSSVSFLGAKSNQLLDDKGEEPSFEAVLKTMFDAGFRGDVYPSLGMWELSPTGVFASYPFPESLDEMRRGGF